MMTREPFTGIRQRQQISSSSTTSTRLYGIGSFFRRRFGKDDDDSSELNEEVETAVAAVTDTNPKVSISEKTTTKSGFFQKKTVEEADICVIGGGVAGLVAAEKAATATGGKKKVVLLEASPTLGGRVQSDVTDDGFILDRGFAVFIEKYPAAMELLDYDELGLCKFLPGALVKVPEQVELARVADPFRQPGEIFTALLAPVGTVVDKIKVLPLLFSCVSKSLSEIFDEKEVSTMEALENRWKFSEEMIAKFYQPFLEGIYLSNLEEQSSRMFHFVFKMFSEGAATLPTGGIGAVANQLVSKAKAAGVDIRADSPVAYIGQNDEEEDTEGVFVVDVDGSDTQIKAKAVVVATDATIAQSLLGGVEGLGLLKRLPEQPQRKVGCLYYSFDGTAPVEDPILVLSGMQSERGSEENPVNNICFPSQVNPSYAPEGKGLCSVTVLEAAMKMYEGRESELDQVVRKELSRWFPEKADAILKDWTLQKIYYIPNAQPGQMTGPAPANVNGGRDCQTFRGKELPKGLLVCGDHVATATLNGALESGVKAGAAAAKLI